MPKQLPTFRPDPLAEKIPESPPTGWLGDQLPVPWDRIIGQEHAKRAVEVAIAGKHSLFLAGSKHSQCEDLASWAREHGADQTFAAYPCLCGWFGDPQRECTCTLKQVTAHQKKAWPRREPDIWIAMARVPDYRVQEWPQHPGEPWSNVAKRLARYMERAENPAFLALDLDEAGKQLIAATVRHLHLGPEQVQRTVAVARTIATLAGEAPIRTAHLAEAIQYRQREWVA